MAVEMKVAELQQENAASRKHQMSAVAASSIQSTPVFPPSHPKRRPNPLVKFALELMNRLLRNYLDARIYDHPIFCKLEHRLQARISNLLYRRREAVHFCHFVLSVSNVGKGHHTAFDGSSDQLTLTDRFLL